MHSHICRLIHDNPDTWKDIIAEKNIVIKTEDKLTIFNYGIVCDFTDPVVQEARGIIINTDTLEVVCWPFRKFGNYNESYADDIDWSTAHVQDKIDGSIIKLWYDKPNQRWMFSTNSVINAENAKTAMGHSFKDVIMSADNFYSLKFEDLNKNNTYIFELVSPETRVVINYPFCRLYHIGTRSNITGKELITDVGIAKPCLYDISNLDKCINAAASLNDKDDIKREGFVVVDRNFHRIKVKSPQYLIIHHIRGNNACSREHCLKLLTTTNINIDKFCANYPYQGLHVRYYQFKLAELRYEATMFINYARNLYKELSFDRKATANMIKTHKYASLAFSALDNNRPAESFIDDLTVSRLEKLIPEYSNNFDPTKA